METLERAKLVDTIHYVYYEPVIEDDGSLHGDNYGVVGFRKGKGIWSEIVAAGTLAEFVGPIVAENIVLGQGKVVKASERGRGTTSLEGFVRPFLSVHGKGPPLVAFAQGRGPRLTIELDNTLRV
jgi:hypothetical protein